MTPTVTLKLSGLSGGALRLGRRLTAKGLVTPSALAGSTVALTVQRRQNGTWRKVKTALCTVRASGAYSWTYRPARRGTCPGSAFPFCPFARARAVVYSRK